MDDDLDRMTPAELLAEVKKLRGGIRTQPDHGHAGLSELLPEAHDADSSWGMFCGGCLPAPPSATHEKDFAAPPRPIVSLQVRRRA
jgi:hypothetical protein